MNLADYKHLPIGVFDSGVGGLTVLKALKDRLPHEDFIYLGDTARLPYGTKSADTVMQYALSCAQVLKKRGIKLLVVACNTAASVALEALTKAFYPIPVVGVIGPGALAACEVSQSNHVTVLATEGTVRSHAYQLAIHQIKPQMFVEERSCSLLVSLAEEGWVNGPLVEAIIARLIHPELVCDTLVLGCTHFPVFKHAIQNVIGSDIQIVDSAYTTAQAVERVLIDLKLMGEQKGKCHFIATDNLERFQKIAGVFLKTPVENKDIELVDI